MSYSPNFDENPLSNEENENKEEFSTRTFLLNILNLKDKINKTQTRDEIKSNISFKGIPVYILAASIVIASIGLYSNSTAVVIGAMLLSPLMGPIIGFGYGFAVNDMLTIRRSLVNALVMVFVSILTSFLFFKLIGFVYLTDELRGRLEPTMLDVLIAFFGGFAGILAASSKDKNINAIAGVAIATALMPPLCTVGFGLAVGSDPIGYKDFNGWWAALNAFYLFFINSTFIAIATWLFVRYLRFPLKKFEDAKKRKRRNIVVGAFGIIVLLPSIFIFYGILRDGIYKRDIQSFLNEYVQYTGASIHTNPNEWEVHETDSLNYINISSSGKTIPLSFINEWNQRLKSNENLKNTRLNIYQGLDADELKKELSNDFMKNFMETSQSELLRKDSIIVALKSQINGLQSDSIPFSNVSHEIKDLYPGLEEFSYSIMNTTDFKQRRILPLVLLKWKKGTYDKAKVGKLRNFLNTRLKQDTIVILNR